MKPQEEDSQTEDEMATEQSSQILALLANIAQSPQFLCEAK